MPILRALWIVIRSLILRRSSLTVENLALRHQLAVLQRSSKRPRLRQSNRIFWVWLFRALWSEPDCPAQQPAPIPP